MFRCSRHPFGNGQKTQLISSALFAVCLLPATIVPLPPLPTALTDSSALPLRPYSLPLPIPPACRVFPASFTSPQTDSSPSLLRLLLLLVSTPCPSHEAAFTHAGHHTHIPSAPPHVLLSVFIWARLQLARGVVGWWWWWWWWWW